MSYSIKEGKELYSAGQLHGQWPALELLDKIGSIQAFRDALKPKRKRIRSTLIAAIISTVIFAILTFSLSDSFLVIIGILGLLVSTVILVISIVRTVRLNEDAFNPDAAALIGPLVRCIGPDLAKNVPVTVTASLKSPFVKEYLVKEGPKYSTAVYNEGIDRFYKRQVLNLECRLSDGTRLLAGIVEHSIEKILKKKNPRGKWKTKKKHNRKLGIRVRVQLDNTRSRLTGQFKLPPDTVVRVRQNPRGDVISLSLKRTVKDTRPLDASLLLSLMAGAYNAVTPVSNKQVQSGGEQ